VRMDRDDPCGGFCEDDAPVEAHWGEHVRRCLGHEPRDHWFFGGRRFMTWWEGHEPTSANPLVSLVLSRGGGLLPLYVLHLLALSPRHGNDIMRELGQRSQGTWASNPGAIYPLLRFMEHRGLLEGEWADQTKRTRRIYHLTEPGRQEYTRLKELMQPGLREALQVMQGLYDELYGPSADTSIGLERQRAI
jgi:DNA-binding PadR family transcriptional regulator